LEKKRLVSLFTIFDFQINEESTRFLREEGKKVLTFKIPLSYSGAAGLGISVKGKVEGEIPQDKGIYVKSVIAGGAAQKVRTIIHHTHGLLHYHWRIQDFLKGGLFIVFEEFNWQDNSRKIKLRGLQPP